MKPDRSTGSELSLLLVPGPTHDLGIVASAVRDIVAEPTWQGDPPLDFLRLTLGVPAGEGEARVLLVDRPGADALVLRVVGRLRMHKVARTAALPLPPLIAPHARWVSSVVIADDAPPILVVACEHLGQG